MKTILFIILSFLFFSCYTQRRLERQPADNNEKYAIDYLFTHDGCKVYRFTDCGNFVYFTTCEGETYSKIDTLDQMLNQNMMHINNDKQD